MTRSSSVVHMSLNRPRLVAGVGSEAFGLIVVMGVMAMNLRSLPIALSIPPMFLFLRWVYRKDAVLLKPGEWGKLPPKLARDLMEAQREGVSGEYRAMVETYFRVIAEKAREKK